MTIKFLQRNMRQLILAVCICSVQCLLVLLCLSIDNIKPAVPFVHADVQLSGAFSHLYVGPVCLSPVTVKIY